MKTKSTMKELGLLDDPKYFREISFGGRTRKVVHPRAVDRIQEAIITGEVDIEEAWEQNKGDLFEFD